MRVVIAIALLLALAAPAQAETLSERLGDELVRVVHAPKARARQIAGVLLAAGATESEARALLATAWRESSLRYEVEFCVPEHVDAEGHKVRSGVGALGEIGLWQARRGGGLCGDLGRQARRALGHWRDVAGPWERGGWEPDVVLERSIGAYMGRSPTKPKEWAEVETRIKLVQSMQGGAT